MESIELISKGKTIGMHQIDSCTLSQGRRNQRAGW